MTFFSLGKHKMNLKKLDPFVFVSIISFFVLLSSYSFKIQNSFVLAMITFFLMTSILSSVHHAEIIAEQVGEALGTLILALSVTVIEVGLIISLMSSQGPEASYIARDTVFAAIMIVCNGIVGLSFILGGLRYKEQGFRVDGSASLLIVLIALSALTFVLPSFTSTTKGPTYNTAQLIFVSITCLVLYFIFILFQNKTHKDYFESSNLGTQSIEQTKTTDSDIKKSLPTILTHFVAMTLSLISVIGLAKMISPTLESFLIDIGAPKATVGIIIAAIVLLPETWAAVKAARENRLQTSLNLALGSGIASIALTIPAVGLFSLLTEQDLALGLDGKGLVFLFTTFLIGGISLASGKSTALQGFVHIVILASYFVLALIP